jgi:glycosyltransferase involved in cell wall biosynthesis
MGKQSKPKQTVKDYKPFVSVCTPTFNRRPFIPIMFACFKNQTYPMDRIEWIIVDDGTDRIKDLVETSGISNIKYFELDKKMPLGEKRNYMHKQAKGSIIVYMDDDDYYPPERIEHAVDKLQKNKEALCAGSSEMYIYFKHIKKMYQCGPYGPNHATAGTFAFKSRMLDDTKYEDHAALAEEKAFLKNYTIPFVQLDPMKTILVFSHIHNTFDKKKLLENPHPDYFKESAKKVSDFIRTPAESWIKNFFLTEIDKLLENYEPGEPKMKPDVLKQTKQIEEDRKKMIEEQMKLQQQNGGAPQGGIMAQEPGKPPRMLSMEETVQLIQTQQQDIESLTNRNKELEDIIAVLQNKIASFSVQGAKNEKQNAVNVDTSNINMQLNLNRPMPPPLLPVEQKPEKPKSEPDITFAL